MKGFEDVTLTWAGESFTVPATGVLMLCGKIEDALRSGRGGSAVALLLQDGGPGDVRLSCAFGAAIRHAGGTVTDEEVYLKLHDGLADGSTAFQDKMQQMIFGILSILSPPAYAKVMKLDQAADPEKKPKRAAKT